MWSKSKDRSLILQFKNLIISRLNDCSADSDTCKYVDIVRLISPDVVVFLTSLFAVLSSRSLNSSSGNRRSPSELALHFEQPNSYLSDVIPVFVWLMLLLGGIIQPNMFTAVYFLAFLMLGVCWAFHLLDHFKKNTSFLVIKLLLTCYAGLHVVVIYLYQFPFFQDALLPDTFIPRYVVLKAVFINRQYLFTLGCCCFFRYSKLFFLGSVILVTKRFCPYCFKDCLVYLQ